MDEWLSEHSAVVVDEKGQLQSNVPEVWIDFEGIVDRVIGLPVRPGHYQSVFGLWSNTVMFIRAVTFGLTGADGGVDGEEDDMNSRGITGGYAGDGGEAPGMDLLRLKLCSPSKGEVREPIILYTLCTPLLHPLYTPAYHI